MHRFLFAIIGLLSVAACQLSEPRTMGLAPVEPDNPDVRNITGTAQVVGPQDLLIEGVQFSLAGIDAPAAGTAAALAAEQALMRIVQGSVVTCTSKGNSIANREWAVCFLGRLDVASALVATGTVLACDNGVGLDYKILETAKARASVPRSGNC